MDSNRCPPPSPQRADRNSHTSTTWNASDVGALSHIGGRRGGPLTDGFFLNFLILFRLTFLRLFYPALSRVPDLPQLLSAPESSEVGNADLAHRTDRFFPSLYYRRSRLYAPSPGDFFLFMFFPSPFDDDCTPPRHRQQRSVCPPYLQLQDFRWSPFRTSSHPRQTLARKVFRPFPYFTGDSVGFPSALRHQNVFNNFLPLMTQACKKIILYFVYDLLRTSSSLGWSIPPFLFSVLSFKPAKITLILLCKEHPRRRT